MAGITTIIHSVAHDAVRPMAGAEAVAGQSAPQRRDTTVAMAPVESGGKSDPDPHKGGRFDSYA